MKNKNIEKCLLRAVENETPDIRDSILAACDARPRGEAASIPQQKSLRAPVLRPLYAAAMLLLLVGLFFGAELYQTAYAVTSVVTLDVNPSIKLKANKEEKLLAAEGLNSDGKALLASMKEDGEQLEGIALAAAAAALVRTMADEGYLKGADAAVLVSVENENTETGAELRERLTAEIGAALKEKGVDGAILGQDAVDLNDFSDLAEQLDISTGKAALIGKIVEADPGLEPEALAKLSIGELGLLASMRLEIKDGLIIVGELGLGTGARLVTDAADAFSEGLSEGLEDSGLLSAADGDFPQMPVPSGSPQKSPEATADQLVEGLSGLIGWLVNRVS